MAIIGIDLGTSNSAALLHGGRQPGGRGHRVVLRLRGKGLPRSGYKGKGDLYLQIGVHIPEKLSREERELHERLRALSGKARRHFQA